MAIPQTFIQELIARADVVDIVGRYVQLKKGGATLRDMQNKQQEFVVFDKVEQKIKELL